MRWPWTKEKEYPEFWEKYSSAFAKAKSERKKNARASLVSNTRFVVLDTETTGLDVKNDRILSIGAVSLKGRIIEVSNSLEFYLKQDKYNPESAPIHGILKNGNYEKVNEVEAIKACLDFIGTDILVGHHIGFDIAIINKTLKRHGVGKLKNKVLDTSILYKRMLHPVNYALVRQIYTLDELSESLKIPMYDRHTAAGDAMITSLAFIKIMSRINSDGLMKVKSLFQ